MPIITWEPFGRLDQLLRDTPFMSLDTIGRDMAIDMYEEDGSIRAHMNIPGVDPSKINVSVDDGSLRVSCTHQEKKEEKKRHYYSKEIRQGSFERVISLPCAVDKDKVVAEYTRGVLTITLPTVKGVESSRAVEVKVKK